MMNKTRIGLAALMVLLSLGACKKSSDDETTKPSLSGLGVTQAPAFITVGTSLTFEADTRFLQASDGTSPSPMGIYWQVNDAKKDTLTKDIAKSNPAFIYKADTLGAYTVFCYAFAGADYYNASASSSFRAVDPAKVLSGTAAAGEITVKGKTWMARNASHATLGLSFRNSPVLDNIVGRLFSWQDAQTVCPAGWHLPTVAEFEASFAGADGTVNAGDLMADASFLEEKMWTYWPQVTITNKYGFNALPLGYIDTVDTFSAYEKYGEYASWWTADQNGDTGTFLYIFQKNPTVQKGQGDKKSLAMGVRCVKD